ncbi:MAG: heme-binding protein [Paracoccaceae bacterium]|nr:heme-binding protein [Paracoccaceae bacterium]MDE3120762.1 heme-binding protein [Paracoccaceae bacterium]MDE3238161.1 heme-binding protein [Paracoccaceae bacterium]
MRRIILAAALIGLAATAEAEMYKGYETPDYRVERTSGEVEIRSYPAHLVAEVTVSGDRSTAANRGFRILAGYIFGGNAGSEKIAMTTPVREIPQKIAMTTPVTQTGSADSWTITFGMPAVWTRDSLPKPKDDRIRFREVPAERLAAIRFSGWPTQGSLDRHARTLRDELAKMGEHPEGAPFYMFYDSPFTLPWNRRNEVALRLK